jgi:hypothetical protein
MTLLSTIVAFLVQWVLGCCMVSRGPWSTLIPNDWSLKEDGAWNHLPLWGNKSLFSRLRHRLKTLSDGRMIGLAGEELTLMRGLELELD